MASLLAHQATVRSDVAHVGKYGYFVIIRLDFRFQFVKTFLRLLFSIISFVCEIDLSFLFRLLGFLVFVFHFLIIIFFIVIENVLSTTFAADFTGGPEFIADLRIAFSKFFVNIAVRIDFFHHHGFCSFPALLLGSFFKIFNLLDRTDFALEKSEMLELLFVLKEVAEENVSRYTNNKHNKACNSEG